MVINFPIKQSVILFGCKPKLINEINDASGISAETAALYYVMLELKIRLKTVKRYEFDWWSRVLLHFKLVNICTPFIAYNLSSTPTTVQPVGV